MQNSLILREEASLDDYIAQLEALGGPEMAGLDPLQRQRYAKLKQERRRVVQRIDSRYAFDDLRRSTLAGNGVRRHFRILFSEWCVDAWDSITCARVGPSEAIIDG